MASTLNCNGFGPALFCSIILAMDKNYKDKLLEAMKASGEERKREEEARKFNGKGLFIVMIVILAVIAVAALISKF